MQTQKPAEQKSEQASGRVSNNLKNTPVSQKPATKQNTVRTTEYKKMIEICLTEPESVTRDEFIAFQSAMGYGQTVRLMEEGKRRKMAGKGEKKESEANSTAGKPKQQVDTAKTDKNDANKNEIKTDQNKVTTEKSLTKTILDTSKPKDSVTEPVPETKAATQATAKAAVETSEKAAAHTAAPKTAVQIAAKTAAQSTPKAAIQTAAPKTAVQTSAKAEAQTAPKTAMQTAAKAATQAASTAAMKTAAKAATPTAPKTASKAAAQAEPNTAEQVAVTAEEQAVQKYDIQTKSAEQAVAVTDANAEPITATQKSENKDEQVKPNTAGQEAIQKGEKSEQKVEMPATSNKGSNVESRATVQEAATGTGKNSDQKPATSDKSAGAASILGGEGGVKGPSAEKINESLKAKRQVKPAPKITGEDPGQIIKQLGSADATQVINTFSDANAASQGAFEKEREKTQKLLPEIPTPTGLDPVSKQGNINKKQDAVVHKGITDFKSTKTGGQAQEGNIKDFNLAESEDLDEKDVMKEARACAENAPEISMSGEADPSQIDGFEVEAQGNVQDSKQAELEQVKQEFGENNILPKIDDTILKAKNAIRAATPKNIDIKKMEPTQDDVASRVDPSVNDTLKAYMDKQNVEYEKGKAEYDAGVVAEKAAADEKIESEKAQASEKQIEEQEKAKTDVEGYRTQWQSEIDQATLEYDTEANTEVEGKKKEVGDIKDEKDSEVKSTLETAETDAEKECETAKKDADEEEKKGEKEKEKEEKSWIGKAWDWVKDKTQKIVDGIKSVINGIFNALRNAVKTIFEKAKQAALALIEAGRKLIVDCIKGLGEILKKLVMKLLEKFPGIAKKICDLIDAAVNKAIEVVNTIADGLKKAVTVILDTMAKGFDTLFAGLQNLYNGIMDGIKKFLSMDFMEILRIALEAAQIAAELALAFASGGGSVLIQIGKWLINTLPGLIDKAKAIMDFVRTIKNIKLDDIKAMLNPSGIADFLVKGLFGELEPLPGAESEKGEKGEEEAAEPASGGSEKGLMKILSIVKNVFNKIKGVYGKVAGAINNVLGKINITKQKWFEPFSMIYAGVVKVIEVAKDPAAALSDGVAGLKASAGDFFGGIKTKITDVAGDIKEKVAILGKPAELLKVILNKGVDMVLNFIITNPPSALLKALFKLIEAVAGKSLVELIRQTIPFADALLNKISESKPVQDIASPLQGPISKIGGAIDDVTSGVTGIVDGAEQSTMTAFDSGEKLISGFIGGGKGGSSKGGSAKGGNNSGGKGGGGDFFGTLKSGIHTRLVSLGEENLKTKGKELVDKGVQKGKDIAKAGINKGKEVVVDSAGKIKQMLTPKVKFKLGNEDHELWVEKGKNKNVVMMASDKAGPVEDKVELDNNTKGIVDSIENDNNIEDNPNITVNKKGTIIEEMQKRYPEGISEGKDDFEGTLRGEKIQLPGVKTKQINYVKRNPEETAKLRNAFDTEKKKFLKSLTGNVEKLKKAGLTDSDIARMKDELNPKGWQVHHKLPLDGGGTNAMDNLVLIKNEPYHKTITNFQNTFAKQLNNGEIKKVEWPIPEGNIYPPNN